MRRILLIILIVSGFLGNANAGYLTRTEDVNGWTVFTPSDDTRICYVSAADSDGTGTAHDDGDAVVGANPFQPSGDVDEFPTYAAAYAATRSGYPDWILFKRGETFTVAGLGTVARSGRGATEPFLIGSYGASGNSPVIQTGTSGALSIAGSTSYLAISGIDFYAHTRDPYNGGAVLSAGAHGISIYSGAGTSAEGLLIEGCKLRFYSYGSSCQANDRFSISIEYRKNLIEYNYNTSDAGQGIYASSISNMRIEGNVFNHNGWLIQRVDADYVDGQAADENHAIYLNDMDVLDVNENLFLDPSAASVKTEVRVSPITSHEITNNLIVGGHYGLSLGHNNYDGVQYRNHDVSVLSNVFSNIGRGNNCAGAGSATANVANAIWPFGFDSSTISGNLIIHQSSDVTGGQGIVFAGTGTDPIRNTAITNNIVYNHGVLEIIRITSNTSGSSGVTFVGNKLQCADIANANVFNVFTDITSSWALSAGQYYADSQTFYRNGSTVDLSGWSTWTGDNSTWTQVSFPAPTRDVGTYMTSLGETGTIDAFITLARSQDRYDWDSRLEADTINDWIRAGFGIYAAPAHTLGAGPSARIGEGPGFVLE